MSTDNIQLTKNFSLREMVGGTAMPSKAVEMNWKALTPEMIEELQQTAEMMEDIRQMLCNKQGHEVKISVNCAYRCQEWETYRGRKGTSQHALGTACDFTPSSTKMSKAAIRELILWLYNELNPTWAGGLAIMYPDLKRGTTGFIHLDRRPFKARWSY